MKPVRLILVLSLSIVAITAAPIDPTLSNTEDFNSELPPSLRETFASPSAFQAFAVQSPSGFLVEFDLPAAGISRFERVRLEQEDNGEFREFLADRHARVSEQHKTFQEALADDLHVDYTLRQEFFTLMNGMSIDLQTVPASKLPGVLEKIRSMPGVVKVSPLISLSQPKTITHDIGFDASAAIPQLSTAHEQTGVLKARNDLHLSGKGIKVGIIDTGVDYTHEALGSCYGPGCKVEFGYDFVDPQRSEAAGGFDCVGHGTHVAGIIAGNSTKSNFFGVAPQATIGAYRVFPCTGSSKDDVIIAALEQAYTDNMDIVNLSLGGGSSWANTPLSRAAGRLVQLGVVVVAAIGNDGEQGLEEVSSPSINPHAISVASFEGSGYMANYFEIEGVPDTRIDYAESPTNTTMREASIELIVPEQREGCIPYSGPITGNVALIKRGNCTFVAKAKFAQDAGAIGCIFYNNVEGGLHPKSDDPSIHIFGQGISLAQGKLIMEQLKAANSTSLKIIYREKGVFKNEMANQLSIFSSWGLGPELELKPDIGAPGGYIYSTIPVEKGSFATMSGTSMATPFVAGSAALLLQAEPTIDRSEVLGRLQMYSKPGLYKNTQVPDTVARQGAGMINVLDAIQGKAFVMPSHLALNDTLHSQEAYTITLTNKYPTSETFKVSNWPAMSILGYTPAGQPTDKVIYNETSAEFVILGGDSIELAAGETRSFKVQFKPPANLSADSHWIYSGYVKIEPTTNSSRPALHVPYAGMHGSYGSIDMLDLQEGFPVLLGPSSDGKLAPILSRHDQPPQTFFMSRNNLVTLILKVSNPLHNLQVYVLDAKQEKIAGVVPVDGEYIGRTDSVRAKFFVVPWSGRIVDTEGDISRVPDGDYTLLVIAPKPFTDSRSENEGDHERWLSPTIRIRHY